MSQVLTPTPAETSTFGLADSLVAQFVLYKVLRRNGNVVEFDPQKIAVAMTKAFLAVEGTHGNDSSKVRDIVNKLTGQVVETLLRRLPGGGVLHIEHIQDQVELALMRTGEQEVARRYVIYRETRSRERAEKEAMQPQAVQAPVGPSVTRADGVKVTLKDLRLEETIKEACENLGPAVDYKRIYESTVECLYEGVTEDEVIKSAIMSARALVEVDPTYSYVTAICSCTKYASKSSAKPPARPK